MRQRCLRVLPHAVALLLYGGAAHGLLFGGGDGLGFSTGPEGAALAARMGLAVVVFGGIFTSLLLVGLLDRALSVHPPHPIRTLVEGGFRGMAATLLAVEASSLVGAAALTGYIISHPTPQAFRALHSGASPEDVLFLFLFGAIDVSTYAMGPGAAALPVSFLVGCGAAAYLLLAARAEGAKLRWDGPVAEKGTVCLALAVLAVGFDALPPVGLALAIAAVAYGLWSGVWRRGAQGEVVLGRAGTVLGLAVVAVNVWRYWVYGLPVTMWRHRG